MEVSSVWVRAEKTVVALDVLVSMPDQTPLWRAGVFHCPPRCLHLPRVRVALGLRQVALWQRRAPGSSTDDHKWSTLLRYFGHFERSFVPIG